MRFFVERLAHDYEIAIRRDVRGDRAIALFFCVSQAIIVMEKGLWRLVDDLSVHYCDPPPLIPDRHAPCRRRKLPARFQ